MCFREKNGLAVLSLVDQDRRTWIGSCLGRRWLLLHVPDVEDASRQGAHSLSWTSLWRWLSLSMHSLSGGTWWAASSCSYNGNILALSTCQSKVTQDCGVRNSLTSTAGSHGLLVHWIRQTCPLYFPALGSCLAYFGSKDHSHRICRFGRLLVSIFIPVHRKKLSSSGQVSRLGFSIHLDLSDTLAHYLSSQPAIYEVNGVPLPLLIFSAWARVIGPGTGGRLNKKIPSNSYRSLILISKR